MASHVFAVFDPGTRQFHMLPGEYVTADTAGDLEATVTATKGALDQAEKELWLRRQENAQLRGDIHKLTNELAIAKAKVEAIKAEVEPLHAALQKRAADHNQLIGEFCEIGKQRDLAMECEKRALAIVERQAKEISELKVLKGQFVIKHPRKIRITLRDNDRGYVEYVWPFGVEVIAD